MRITYDLTEIMALYGPHMVPSGLGMIYRAEISNDGRAAIFDYDNNLIEVIDEKDYN